MRVDMTVFFNTCAVLTDFENGMLKRIFGSKMEQVTGEWKELHSVELNNLYCSPNIFW